MSGAVAARVGIFQRLRASGLQSRVRPRSLQSQGISLNNLRPVFNGQRRWWDRWIYTLVAIDLVVTASLCELVWDRWTHLVPDQPYPDASSAQPDDVSQRTAHYVLRPAWQRASLAAYTLAGGVGIAFGLLIRRGRLVHKLYIIPDTVSKTRSKKNRAAERSVVIQSPIHSEAVGIVWPLERARLLAPNQYVMQLALKGGRASYILALDGAEICGKKMSTPEARKTLLTLWYGEKKGTQMYVASTVVAPIQ